LESNQTLKYTIFILFHNSSSRINPKETLDISIKNKDTTSAKLKQWEETECPPTGNS
jgi:hypothetical protein